MWSRKGSPVEMSARPRPSRSTLALSCVSLLFRVTWPFLFKSHLDCMGVRAQAFHLGETDARLTQRLQVAAVEAQHAQPLQERVHAKRRRKPGGARGGQRVVGSRRIFPQRTARVDASDDRTGVVHLRSEAVGVRA